MITLGMITGRMIMERMRMTMPVGAGMITGMAIATAIATAIRMATVMRIVIQIATVMLIVIRMATRMITTTRMTITMTTIITAMAISMTEAEWARSRGSAFRV
jgi:uncharacterized membrane protein (Fun14 family)